MSFFRRVRRPVPRPVQEAPRVAPWPDMPPRPRLQEPPPVPFQPAMGGGIDDPFSDPCGAPPIAVGKNGRKP